MTFNLRFPNPDDGPNNWFVRKGLMVKTILKYAPSLVATQEGTEAQLRYLERELNGYGLFVKERVWDDTSQYPTIFYKKSEIKTFDGGEFWLSLTSGVHLTKNWGSAYPRMLAFVRVRSMGWHHYFWFAATHLDNVSSEARLLQAKMIRDWVEKRDDPVILAGDFNDVPNSEVYNILVRPDGPFVDTWRTCGKPEDESSFTHHGFKGVPEWGRLDWILVDPVFKVLDCGIGKDSYGGRYPSDHFPYWTDIDLKEEY